MSDRVNQHGPAKDRTRVFKSHQVLGMGVAMPAVEQVAPGDLPFSLSMDQDQHPEPQTTSSAVVRLEDAKAAEERAQALERRAAALLNEAEETVRQRLQQVESQIEEVLSKTMAAVDKEESDARARGHTAGREEGYSEGVEAAKLEAEQILTAARQAAEMLRSDAELEAEVGRHNLVEERSALLNASREQILDLAFVMARQILKAEVSLRPESIVPMVESALSKMKGEMEPQVRVSPGVLALLEEHRGRLLSAIPGARKIAFESDGAMGPGDFVVQGAGGVVDGRLPEQLKILEDTVRGER